MARLRQCPDSRLEFTLFACFEYFAANIFVLVLVLDSCRPYRLGPHKSAWDRLGPLKFFSLRKLGGENRCSGLWSRFVGTQPVGDVGKSRIMSLQNKCSGLRVNPCPSVVKYVLWSVWRGSRLNPYRKWLISSRSVGKSRIMSDRK
jgi:hypothetical protein